jgi:hypothetical protein
MGKKYLLKFPVTEKSINPEDIVPISILVDLRNKCEDEELKEVLQKVLEEKVGKVSYEEVVVDWNTYDFPLKLILDSCIERKGG